MLDSKMSTISFCVILSLCLGIAWSDSFPEVWKRETSDKEYEMLVTEDGNQYIENVTIDTSNNAIVHDVSQHGSVSESHVLIDFDLNLVVTRLTHHPYCYVRTQSPGEPSLQDLKEGMETASKGKNKIKTGFRVITTQWVIKGEADLKKLSDKIITFCHGRRIFMVEKSAVDGTKVIPENSAASKRMLRLKRQEYVLCRPWTEVREDLKQCHRSQWKLKCKFLTRNCFHYVYCTNNKVELRSGVCTSTHKFDDFTCCTPSCT